MSISYIRWAGIERAPKEFLMALWEGCQVRGWDANDLAGHISHESGFRTDAKAIGATASGLIQIVEVTAKGLGTTTERIRSMSHLEQLPLIFRYFGRASNGFPMKGAAFLRAGFGNGANDWAAPWSKFLAMKGRPAYDLNAALDMNKDGSITIGDLENHWAAYRLRAASKGTLEL